MNICYLILTHNNPKHLERMLDAIRSPGSKAFIHLDKKTPMDEFRHLAEREEVVFIEKRIPVAWGGFSDVQATLYLLEAVKTTGLEFDYFSLLSGTHYPVRSPEELKAYLTENKGREFINITAVPNEVAQKDFERFTLVYVDKVYHRRFGLPQKVTTFIARVINKLKFHRKFEPALGDHKPYAGCQWWILSSDAIDYIMTWVEQYPKIVKFFGKTLLPDESFFQTIIGNSPFMPKTQRDLTFTYWREPGAPHPDWLTEEQIEKLYDDELIDTDVFGTTDVYFARKFRDESAPVVELIDQRIDSQA